MLRLGWAKLPINVEAIEQICRRKTNHFRTCTWISCKCKYAPCQEASREHSKVARSACGSHFVKTGKYGKLFEDRRCAFSVYDDWTIKGRVTWTRCQNNLKQLFTFTNVKSKQAISSIGASYFHLRKFWLTRCIPRVWDPEASTRKEDNRSVFRFE